MKVTMMMKTTVLILGLMAAVCGVCVEDVERCCEDYDEKLRCYCTDNCIYSGENSVVEIIEFEERFRGRLVIHNGMFPALRKVDLPSDADCESIIAPVSIQVYQKGKKCDGGASQTDRGLSPTTQKSVGVTVVYKDNTLDIAMSAVGGVVGSFLLSVVAFLIKRQYKEWKEERECRCYIRRRIRRRIEREMAAEMGETAV